jgi:hypothetical protein
MPDYRKKIGTKDEPLELKHNAKDNRMRHLNK